MVRSGVALQPLVWDRPAGQRLLRLRPRSPIWQTARLQVVRKALIQANVRAPRYGVRSAVRTWWATQSISRRPDGTARKAKDLARAATCSEYVLEKLARGAAVMMEQYVQTANGAEFLPADFFRTKIFDHEELPGYELEA
jgi:hypothetical protein